VKKKLFSIGAAVLVLALLLTLTPACGNGGGEVKTLKVGFIGPLSGPAAAWGVDSELGAKWAADKINDAGGIKVGDDRYMVEIISCDTQYTGSVGTVCATRLVHEEGIHYVIGPIGVFEAVDPIFNENKVFYIVQGTVGQPRPESPYRINGITKSWYWTNAYYTQWTEYHPEIKTVVVVSPSDVLGEEFMADTLDIAPRFGVTVLGNSLYEYGTDFYPVLTPLVAKNPDGFDLTGASPPGVAALLTKQIRELGYEGWIIQPAATHPSVLIDIAGSENVWNILSSYPGWSSEVYPKRTQALYQEWLENYASPGETAMGITTSNSYKAMLFFRDTIEEADSIDVGEVMKVIDDPDFRFDIFAAENQRLGGVEEFGIRRQFPHPVPYGEIIDADNVNLSMSVIIVDVP